MFPSCDRESGSMESRPVTEPTLPPDVEVLAVHQVGEYSITEYQDWPGRRCFQPAVAGRPVSRSYHSLDAALVGAIAHKYEGPGTRADVYFLRGIGILGAICQEVG